MQSIKKKKKNLPLWSLRPCVETSEINTKRSKLHSRLEVISDIKCRAGSRYMAASLSRTVSCGGIIRVRLEGSKNGSRK